MNCLDSVELSSFVHLGSADGRSDTRVALPQTTETGESFVERLVTMRDMEHSSLRIPVSIHPLHLSYLPAAPEELLLHGVMIFNSK